MHEIRKMIHYRINLWMVMLGLRNQQLTNKMKKMPYSWLNLVWVTIGYWQILLTRRVILPTLIIIRNLIGNGEDR